MRIFLYFVFISIFHSCEHKGHQFNIKKEKEDYSIPAIDTLKINKKTHALHDDWNDSILKLPYALQKDEISIIIGISYGWLAYNELQHFVYSNNRLIKVFKEKIPKSYLKKNKEKYHLEEIEKNTFTNKNCNYNNLNTLEIDSFLNYHQNDFHIKSNRVYPPCVIDANAYSIYFIQNKKYASYWFYAPKYTLQKCPTENINVKMLQDFVKLLEHWDIEI
ncbi:hypothetical protein [Flavobacterium sp. J27]|uniref:hypothetical protein n=1 Tax=Flavobacterium sp. J27 TaxID=2060419 RepID=UPI001031D44D|nr:hypothetical protein [Flavobacterium sp. J27]